MEIDRSFIKNISKETQFQPDVVEKAYRLALLLQEINNHPILNKELVLKGGTAINFIYLSLPRLSVDLDFNFIGGITKEEKDLKREEIKNDLMPLLRKEIMVSRDKMIKTVKPLLEYVLKLDKQEKRYADDFFVGEYNPELLFVNEKVADMESLKIHPMALWKQQHIREWLVNQSHIKQKTLQTK